MRSRRPGPAPPGTFEHLLTELEVGCPSCGATFTVGEGDTAVRCGHCGRDLLVTRTGQAPQSYARPRLGADEAQAKARGWLRAEGHRATRIGQGRWLLVPFWRYRAKAFKWFAARRTGTDQAAEGQARDTFRDLLVRPYDFTLPASDFEVGVEFIGAREELLVTHLPGPHLQTWADLPPLTVNLDQARARARQRVDRGTHPPGARVQAEKLTLLDEQLEVIYFPFFSLDYQFREDVRRVIVDGWSGSVTAHLDHVAGGVEGGLPASRGDAAEHGDGRAAGSTTDTIAFLPSRCPVCLTEIAPARQDRVHVCPSCRRAWEIIGTTSREVSQFVIDNGIPLSAMQENDEGRLLPFWAIRTVASGWQPMAEQTSGNPLTIYVPAFDGRHIERMCQLGIHLTRACPRFEPHAEWSAALSGCAIGRADATRMAWVMLGSMASPDATSFNRFIEQGEVDIENVQLFWIPFRAAGLYLREPLTGALVQETSTRPWEPADLLAA